MLRALRGVKQNDDDDIDVLTPFFHKTTPLGALPEKLTPRVRAATLLLVLVKLVLLLVLVLVLSAGASASASACVEAGASAGAVAVSVLRSSTLAQLHIYRSRAIRDPGSA